MAPISKKQRRVLKRAEELLGRPVFTHTGPSQQEVTLFVVVFGRRPSTSQVEVLGTGLLTTSLLVLPDEDVTDVLADGGRATSVGIAWVQGSTPHVEQHRVRRAAERVDTNGDPDPSMWAIELTTESDAPIHSSLPEGASPANSWCFLFPWLSFCQSH